MGSNYQEKLQKREALARKASVSAITQTSILPKQNVQVPVARVGMQPARVWVNPETLREARGERQQPIRSPQHQAYSRQSLPRPKPLDLESLVAQVSAQANEVHDREDTSMFSIGEVVYNPRPLLMTGR